MVFHHRRDKIDRIQARIDQLHERAGELLAAEYDQRACLDDLRRQMEESPAVRLRYWRRSRALRRAERVTESLRTKREFLVEEELRSIMTALEKQSRRTRERLDEQALLF